MATISTQESTHAHKIQGGRKAFEISSLVGAFRDGDKVMLKIDECVFHLSPTQAELLAQGFFMAALRTGHGHFDMSWRNEQIHSLSVIPQKTSRMGIRDVTLSTPEADHSFFATGWIYEGTGEDLNYPANVVFFKTRPDGVIEFMMGNDEFLLNPKQAAQLCLGLGGSAGSFGASVCCICEKSMDRSE